MCVLAIVGLLSACQERTGALTAEQQTRFESEGILRRADDLTFRYTHDAGRRDAGWEDRRASIIVTKQRVIIHKNEKLGIELTPRTRRFVQVRREGAGCGSARGPARRRRAGRLCRRTTRQDGRTTSGRSSNRLNYRSEGNGKGGSSEPPFPLDPQAAAQGLTFTLFDLASPMPAESFWGGSVSA